jgi:hypothetical protein
VGVVLCAVASGVGHGVGLLDRDRTGNQATLRRDIAKLNLSVFSLEHPR